MIDLGELVFDGLSCEVEEEMGFVVEEWGGFFYEVVVEVLDFGWCMWVEIYCVECYFGEFWVGDDLDGIVIEVGWVELVECEPCLCSGY